MKTTAAILVEQRRPLELGEVELPKLGYGQVLVEISVSRICGSQIGEVDGVKGEDKWLPHLLGHEGGGTVLEIGPEVKHVKIGDRVVLHWRPGAGIQSGCPTYDWNGKRVNAGFVTTFQRLAVVAENRLTVVPTGTDYEICALLADTLTTGFGVINNDAGVKIGESVVIVGCGGIGLGVVLGAKLAGAHPVVAVDLLDNKLAKAREFGASHTINSSGKDLVAEVEAAIGGKVDVVVDGSGSPAVLESALRMTGPKGRVIGVGVMRHDQKISINTLPLHHGKILTGSEGGGSRPAEDIPRYLRMMKAGVFDPKGMISHHIRLEDINEGMDRMRAGEVTHCVIHFD